MPTEPLSLTQQDNQAVEAVKRGDADRFRELVERYERRVYAVAWSRLGDASLAEEATQEAFIRGYRYLWLLGEGGKFGAWITAIARNVSINLGIRHRRELSKRERWALEKAGTVETGPVDDGHDQMLPGNLRAALAQLPDSQRECLVLFYFEGKSGAEAAAALGISEAAFRVRLHRARSALREQLEERLGKSLEQLWPSRPVTPAVMGAILSSSTTKTAVGAGIGAKILSALGKTALFAWCVPIIPIIGVLPGLAVMSWVQRVERRNYREADGFRARLHWGFFRTFLWGFPLLFVLVMVLQHSALAAWGISGMNLATNCLLFALTLISARSLTIHRNRFQITIFIYCVILLCGTLAVALRWIPQQLAQLPVLTGTVLFGLMFKYRPVRMDYNLYLRAGQGLLQSSEAPVGVTAVESFDRQTLLAFACFLGSRWLVTNFHWEARGLALRLPSVKSRFAMNMLVTLMPMSRRCSFVSLGWDGTVTAHCSKTDRTDLSAMKLISTANPQELETFVAGIVGQAWQEFRAGNLTLAERALGEIPDTEVFVVPVAKSAATRWGKRLIIGSAVLSLSLLLLVSLHPPWLDGMKSVSVTETDVRAFLGSITTNPNPIVNNTQLGYAGDPIDALSWCLVLPPTNLITSSSLHAVQEELLGRTSFQANKKKRWRLYSLQNNWTLHKAMEDGWISWDDVELKPQEVTEYLHHLKTNEWQFTLGRVEAWSWVKRQRFTVERINDFTLNQLRWLRDVNCLDMVDRNKLIQQIVSVQTLSGAPPGQPPIHDWRDICGLFFTPCSPALQDTYFSLAALEILGGLDKIDREACIQGILKQHRGKGYFTSPASGGYNEYHIEGDARDTFSAFESLRILNALDRVHDLDQWQFRLPSRSRSDPSAKPRPVTWEEVEAWVCQQRFERFLRERRENPQSPTRSLLTISSFVAFGD